MKVSSELRAAFPGFSFLDLGRILSLILLLSLNVLANDHPNILLVTLDTMRADRLGCYGYRKAETSVLDQLARNGIRFEKVFTTAPLTLPAHASIMTGMYPPAHGIRDNVDFSLPPQDTTLAMVLKKIGYSTAAFVGAYVLDSKFGLNHGFDYYYDDFNLTHYESVSPGYIRHSGDLVAGRAIRWLNQWLEKRRELPFFVWVHLYDCHDPYTSPEPYASRHRGSPYDGAVAFDDANVGKIVSWMKHEHVYDKTLIIVVGDHGESLGEHGKKTHGFFIYNSTLHVPLIIRFPGETYAGKTIKQNVSIVDIFPTVLAVLGIDQLEPHSVQGHSLLSLIEGKSDERSTLYAETYYPRLEFGWSQLRCLITSKYKYILAPKPEIYDLSTDFNETHNLISANRAVANQLHVDLNDLIRRISLASSASNARQRPDKATVERLRSLGYVALSMGNSGSDGFQSLADPKDEIRTYNKILALMQRNSQGEYRETIPRYQRIIRSQPKIELVHYELGQAYFHTGDLSRAVNQFRLAIALGGGSTVPATFQLATAYTKLGRIDDAVLGFRRVAAMDPLNVEAWVNLGVLLTQQRNYAEAITTLKKAESIAPNSVYVLSSLGVAYSLSGRASDAVRALRKAVALAPNDAFLHINLGVIYQRIGRTREAKEQFAIAHRLDPRLGRQ